MLAVVSSKISEVYESINPSTRYPNIVGNVLDNKFHQVQKAHSKKPLKFFPSPNSLMKGCSRPLFHGHLEML